METNDDTPAQKAENIFDRLHTSDNGLSEDEVKQRRLQYGYNELAEKQENPIIVFLKYFWGPIPWMIELAVLLSGLTQQWTNMGIVLVLLVMNGVIGFWEEFQAGNAIAALKAKLALQAKVKRDGRWLSIPARELVPGDIVHLRIGDIIPADAQLLAGDSIEVDQSALTGESLPVAHESGSTIYSGSIVKLGEIDAVVTATGSNTYFGKTASLVKMAHTQSHFQKAVLKIGDYLIIIAIFLVLLIFLVAINRGESALKTLNFALILTVAAIPVALPAVLSVTMAVGARLLSLKHALISRLSAVEEMAGIDILCSDKTGTLTLNQLTLGDPVNMENITVDEVIVYAALASREESQDAIDSAITTALKDKSVLHNYQIIHFTPFDPVHKRTEAQVKGPDGKIFRVIKGAPQVVLALSANADQIRERVDHAVNDFAQRGFRSLAVARTDTDDHLRFLAVLPLFDPPRDDSQQTIATAKAMGVTVKMVTGDQLAIAKEIAGQLGLGKNILDAQSLDAIKTVQAGEMAGNIERADGFAQVFPEHKYHIVEVLQQHRHIVGMTGDGVNDAPALKKADAGIAVSGATDAARAAADIVLMTPGLSVIIDAIKESRKIFQRMNSYAIYRITETIRVLLFMTLSIIIFNFYPVTAVMIVLLAILNDGPILAIAYDNVRYSNVPEKWNMPVVLGISSVLGIVGVISSFGLFYIAEKLFYLNRELIQTFMFLKLAVAGHLTIFITRTRGPFWSIKPSGLLFWSAVLSKILATLAAVYGILMPAIGWKLSLIIWSYALVWFLLTDRIKLIAYQIFEHPHSWTFKKHVGVKA